MHQSVAASLVSILIAVAGCASNTQTTELSEFKGTVLAKATSSWDGAALPAYPRETPEITIVRIVIPPGTKVPMHKHPVINAGVLTRGELTVRTEQNETHKLKAGESIVEVVNTWHYGVNEGTEPVEIIVFYAGAVGTPLTINKSPPAK